MSEAMLRAEEIVHRREDGFVLRVPSLAFEAGKVHGLVGPNGAGKSTLLRLLNLLETPQSGAVFFRDAPVTPTNPEGLEARRQMTLVMENPLLFRTSVLRNLTAGPRFRGTHRKAWADQAREALGQVGLPGFEKRHAHELSRGETQRVAIARALILRPKVLLLDEPFSHIDRKYVRTIERLIPTLRDEQGTTILFTTHDLLQAYRLSDHVVSLVDGKLVNGSLENLFVAELECTGKVCWAPISSSVRLMVVTDLRGKVHVSIPPRDIILSDEPFESSARNCFQGIVRRIQLEDSTVRVVLEVAGDAEFTAIITPTSLNRLGLTIDASVFVTFKSTAVMVF